MDKKHGEITSAGLFSCDLKDKNMITEKQYLKAKKIIADYESEQLNKPVVSGSAHLEDEAEPYCHNCGEDEN